MDVDSTAHLQSATTPDDPTEPAALPVLHAGGFSASIDALA
jgi:hypothetical protein